MITSVENLIFNGVDLADSFTDKDDGTYLIVNSVYGRGITQTDNTLIRVTGMDGAHPSYSRIPVRELVVTLSLKGESFKDLRKRVEVLNGILYTNGKDVPMKFADEPDRTYYGRLDAVTDVVEVSHIYKAELTFICADPYKYAPERILTFPEDVDTAIVDNRGESIVYPTIELTATEHTTFAMVALGGDEDSEYNLIGQPADVDVEVINDKTEIFSESGQTLDSWTDAGTEVDGGVVAGSLSTDNDGITVPSYGSDSPRWHGPALMKEIDPLQDFEIEMMLEGRTTELSQTFRIEFYAFDENMNSLGKMAIKDDTLGVYRKKAEARFGPSAGVDVNFPISKNNYQYSWDFFFGMLRMRRKGNEFEFYVTRINNNRKHVYSLKETLIDSSNQFMGKLRYIQIHIGKFGETERAYGPKIHYIKTSELHYTAIDQTPYIIYPDDVITFDHKAEEILINGEPRMGLKNFGGSFFALEKGDNMLLITPEDSFETRVSMQERYL